MFYVTTVRYIYALLSQVEFLHSLIIILTKLCSLTIILGNPIPTTKLAIQLTNTAIDMAAGRGPCEKSSAVIIQGMLPGPMAKNLTKHSVETTARYDIQSIISFTYAKNSYQAIEKCSFPTGRSDFDQIKSKHCGSTMIQSKCQLAAVMVYVSSSK